ncbi:uncharacterized protein LOC119079797 [Bradysia coprophila]|uniref:uncharacterized protein LOC119079797 n=1 Tax=Bradysia coprophila TaxID=38358 RepID=UPI00187DB61D|nr:uncharacterized protein LOC119079797 [Bradysia coprophila]
MSILYLTTLVVAACLMNGSYTSEISRCPTSPIILEQPKNLRECSSDSKFIIQINHNYDIMFKALAKRDCSCDEKDIKEFRALLTEMRNKILLIIDSYFRCATNDPTEAINDAVASYDSIRKRFRSYGRKAFNQLPSKCNEAIQYVRRLPYISAENTIMSIVTCASLKIQEN